jgi:molybdopterin synthase sulfur carrier subunit
MQLVYFAWVREAIGKSEESRPCPAGVKTVDDLITYLGAENEGYATAFANRTRLRVAVNQMHVGLDHPVREGDEVAIFPPVTGG